MKKTVKKAKAALPKKTVKKAVKKVVINSVKKTVKKASKKREAIRRKPILLNLGCGVSLFSGFINVDKYLKEEDLRHGAKTREGLCANAKFPADAKYIQADMCSLPFKDNYADYIESLEALEHLPFRDVERAVAEMYRVLKPGGQLVMMLPDLDDMCRTWLESVTDKVFNHNVFFNLVQQFYGNQLHDGEYHTAAFTKTYVEGLLNACGFNRENIKVTLYPHGEHPPLFRGARWNPRDIFVIGMMHIVATK